MAPSQSKGFSSTEHSVNKPVFNDRKVGTSQGHRNQPYLASKNKHLLDPQSRKLRASRLCLTPVILTTFRLFKDGARDEETIAIIPQADPRSGP